MKTLLLGTAQWGLDYGVTNASGRIGNEELRLLGDFARTLGVDHLDTAPAYGDSEARIGETCPDFRVQTKVSARGCSEAELVTAVESSIRTLGGKPLWSVLVHDWSQLSTRERQLALTVLREMKLAEKIERFGISAYSEADLDEISPVEIAVDAVQLPISILDQRLLGSSVIAELRNQGAIIQARSIFLQGVILDLGHLSEPARHQDVRKLHALFESRGLTPAAGSVSFIKSLDWVDEVVVGLADSMQLKEFMNLWLIDDVEGNWECAASADVSLLDPRCWPGVVQ